MVPAGESIVDKLKEISVGGGGEGSMVNFKVGVQFNMELPVNVPFQ